MEAPNYQYFQKVDGYLNKLMRSFYFTPDYWVFEEDGTFFHSVDKLEFNNLNQVKMPKFDPTSAKDLQIFISEYLVNSAVKVAI